MTEPTTSTPDDSFPRTGGRKRRFVGGAAAVGVSAALLATALGFWKAEPTVAAAPPLPMVTVARPLPRLITEWDDYVGRFEARRMVEIRPRVSGQIVGVHFTEGAVVRQGQLLFTVDPRPFAAALAEARAGVAMASSELALAQTNLARARRLRDDEAVSQSSLDQLAAQVRAASAALAAAQSRARARALDLEFTRIRAPISGRISDIRVHAGNLVSAAADATLLTTINSLDPIDFTFDVPESLHLKTARHRQAGKGPQTVEIRLQDEAAYTWRGTVDFIDNGINRNAGTIRARATIRNPDYFLTPGMFGNMRLAEAGTVEALLVPDEAIRTDQARKVVLVVGKGGVVSERPVETGPLVGGLRAVRSGLSPGDRIIVQGLQLAAPGARVGTRTAHIVASEKPFGSPISSRPSATQATLAAN